MPDDRTGSNVKFMRSRRNLLAVTTVATACAVLVGGCSTQASSDSAASPAPQSASSSASVSESYSLGNLPPKALGKTSCESPLKAVAVPVQCTWFYPAIVMDNPAYLYEGSATSQEVFEQYAKGSGINKSVWEITATQAPTGPNEQWSIAISPKSEPSVKGTLTGQTTSTSTGSAYAAGISCNPCGTGLSNPAN